MVLVQISKVVFQISKALIKFWVITKILGFGQKLEDFGQNLKGFDKILKSFVQNSKDFGENELKNRGRPTPTILIKTSLKRYEKFYNTGIIELLLG